MVIGTALITIITILWVYFLWSRRRFYAFAYNKPGPIGLPLIGISYKLSNFEDILYNLPKLAQDYNVKTSYTWIGPQLSIYTLDPEIIENIYKSQHCLNKPELYDAFTHLLGNSLISSKTPVWNHHRRLLNPLLTHKNILDFIPVFNKLSKELCGTLESRVGCGEVDVNSIILHATLMTSAANVFGVDFDAEGRTKFSKDWDRGMKFVIFRMTRPWTWRPILFRMSSKYERFMKASAAIMNFVRDVVIDKIDTLKKNELKGGNDASVDVENPKAKTLADQAINIHLRNELTFEEVVSELAALIFASYDTTAIAMYSTLVFLAMHPQYQERAFEEILAGCPNEEVDVNCEDLKNLVYLNMCIDETLRLAPSAPLLARYTSDDIPLSKDVILPKGSQIIVDLFNLHRDNDIWGPNALTFDPDNFLPPNVAARHSYSFIPFSKGQRNCIGWQYGLMSMKVSLAHILRKYRFTTTFLYEDLKFFAMVTLKYKTYPLLEIHRRYVLYELPKFVTDYNVKTGFTWFGPQLTLYSIEPEVIETIYNSPNCLNKPELYGVIAQFIGSSLISSETPVWNHYRKMFNPLLSHRNILGFVPVFNKLSKELCGTLESHVGCGEVDVRSFVFSTSMKISAANVFGIDLDAEGQAKWLNDWGIMTVYVFSRMVRPWMWHAKLFRMTSLYEPFIKTKDVIMNYCRDMVIDKIDILKKNELQERNDESVAVEKPKAKILADQAINIYLRNELTFEEVVSELAASIFASYETTAIAMYSTLMFLAMHPQYQERAFEEILAVFPDEELDVNCEDFKKLVYLNMCINETLRLSPSIPLMGRYASDDVPLSKDVILPKGSLIILDAFNLHRDKAIWGPNALSFDPDNFLPANVAARHSYSFIPFSKGQRNCLGWQYALMSLKIGLSQILRKYRFTTSFRYEDLKFYDSVTLKYKTYPLLEIHRR